MDSTGFVFMMGLVGGFIVKYAYSIFSSYYYDIYGIKNYKEEIDHLAMQCHSVEVYKKIVSSIFTDGFLSYGRLVGVTLFTQSVCVREPQIAEDIKCHYIRFITSLRLGASVKPNTEKPKDKNKV